MQLGLDWTTDVSLPVSGKSPIARHHSAKAAQSAAVNRGRKTIEYLELLEKVGARGVTDHDAARMLGVPLSSVNSIRNNCGDLIEPRSDASGVSPFGKSVTLWRKKEIKTQPTCPSAGAERR